MIPRPLAETLADALSRAAHNLATADVGDVATTGATLIAVAELVADALRAQPRDGASTS